jgi:hypothetical protein
MHRIKWVIVKLAVYVLFAGSSVVILANLLRPTAPYSAYLAIDVATFLAFAYAYYETKDKFWLISLASVPLMFLSDLYFLGSFSFVFPRGIGVGMNMWAGLHVLVISLGCFLYFKKSFLNYANLIALFATILTNLSFSTFLLSRPSIGYVTALVWQTIVIYFLVYYGMKKKKLVFSAGAIVWYIGLFTIVFYYFFVTQHIQSVTLPVTDKVITLGRGLMGIGAFKSWRLLSKTS